MNINEQKENNLSQLTNDQAINAIYDIMANAFPTKNIKRAELNYEPINDFGLVNPGEKDWMSAITKLDRKIRSKEDAENETPMAEIIQRDYQQDNQALFENISDFCRFAIIIPNYKVAPEVIKQVLNKFGGELTIHNTEEYKALHIHTTYKKTPFEIQVHTKDHAEIKKATDVFYHEYKDIVVPKNSKIEDEKNAVNAEMIKYCQVIYQRSDFQANVPAVQMVYQDYLAQNNGKPKIDKSKLKYFCEIISRANRLQKEIHKELQKFLQKPNLTQNTNQQVTK